MVSLPQIQIRAHLGYELGNVCCRGKLEPKVAVFGSYSDELQRGSARAAYVFRMSRNIPSCSDMLCEESRWPRPGED